MEEGREKTATSKVTLAMGRQDRTQVQTMAGLSARAISPERVDVVADKQRIRHVQAVAVDRN